MAVFRIGLVLLALVACYTSGCGSKTDTNKPVETKIEPAAPQSDTVPKPPG